MVKFSYALSVILLITVGVLSWKDQNFLSFLGQNLSNELTLASDADFKISINKIGFKKLDLMASRSIENGFLKNESREWVPCSVVKAGKSTPCKIRLRGDLPKHWSGIKRSYRIKFKEQSPFWGWKKVDLILPDDKGHEAETVAYDLAKKLKLIAPGSQFANISINGINTGTYFIKQGDSGSLYEMNGRTESMMIKENNIWWYAQNAGGIYNPLFFKGQWDNSNLRSLPLLYAPVFQGKAATDLTFSRFAEFLKLSNDQKDISHHLQQKYFYSWLAIAMTFGSIHSTLPDNLLWYVNGSTGLAEPIIYDVLSEKLWGNPFEYFSHKSQLIKNILKLTWNDGGKKDFEEALAIIDANLVDTYTKKINARKKLREYSEREAKDRFKNVQSNLKLIKSYL